MKIHHVTIPARDPERVARVLAEILGARVIPIPHPRGTQLVYAGDPDGTAIEVWQADTRCRLGGHEMFASDAPLREHWPHHAYISSEIADPERVLAVFAREGWRAERIRNGGTGAGFSLVRGWIENHAGIELVGPEMRAEYERFFAEAARPRPAAHD